MLRGIWKFWSACLITAGLTIGSSVAADSNMGRWSVTVLAGTLTDNNFEDFLTPWKIEPTSPGLFGLALAREIWRPKLGLNVEIEAQIVRHYGLQSSWELNLPVLLRWSRLSWDNFSVISLAFGAGLSYSDPLPSFELERSGETEHLLLYWTAEAEFQTGWQNISLVTRLHHRSNGFGLVGADGGSNGIVIGLRRRF